MFSKYVKKASADTVSDSDMRLQSTLNWLINGVDVENRRIEMRGEVGEGMASYITRALIKLSEISHDPIEIYFSSPGGSVHQGLAIYDAITSCPCDIHMIASGEIMSMGFIIFLAGDKRLAAKHARFMMHSVSYGAEGITKDHEIQVNEAKLMNTTHLEILAKRTKRDKKYWYRSILSHDKYMGVEEAIALGVINTVSLPEKVSKAVKPKTKKVVRKVSKKKARK